MCFVCARTYTYKEWCRVPKRPCVEDGGRQEKSHRKLSAYWNKRSTQILAFECMRDDIAHIYTRCSIYMNIQDVRIHNQHAKCIPASSETQQCRSECDHEWTRCQWRGTSCRCKCPQWPHAESWSPDRHCGRSGHRNGQPNRTNRTKESQAQI